MSLNETPGANRIHIGIFGKRNAGKSSVMNAITGQAMAIVSDTKGTTTDPVSKAMELLPLGPVVLIDTPGLDDEGELGTMRMEKAMQTLHKTDLALLVVDCREQPDQTEIELARELSARAIPFLIVANKIDCLDADRESRISDCRRVIREATGADADKILFVSAKEKIHIEELKEAIAAFAPEGDKRTLVGDLVMPGDLVVLVVPIDSAAPKGRLILPQQQTIRDLLDHHAMAVVTQVEQLDAVLRGCAEPPKLVITDSQAFERVAAIVPDTVPLTSFSILFARYKGELDGFLRAADVLDQLQDGDLVLISEGCTHHRQCEDIGTVKLPGWIRSYTGKKIQFAFTGGTEFPSDLSKYRLVIHCGGCTLNRQEMQHRIRTAAQQGIPMLNYGMAIARMHGILERSMKCLAENGAGSDRRNEK